jgi:hypothetical protein
MEEDYTVIYEDADFQPMEAYDREQTKYIRVAVPGELILMTHLSGGLPGFNAIYTGSTDHPAGPFETVLGCTDPEVAIQRAVDWYATIAR